MIFGLSIIPFCAALLFVIGIICVIVGLVAMCEGDFKPITIGAVALITLYIAKSFGIY
jgi:hypothetical protein